jgi:hypothetical protein
MHRQTDMSDLSPNCQSASCRGLGARGGEPPACIDRNVHVSSHRGLGAQKGASVVLHRPQEFVQLHVRHGHAHGAAVRPSGGLSICLSVHQLRSTSAPASGGLPICLSIHQLRSASAPASGGLSICLSVHQLRSASAPASLPTVPLVRPVWRRVQALAHPTHRQADAHTSKMKKQPGRRGGHQRSMNRSVSFDF